MARDPQSQISTVRDSAYPLSGSREDYDNLMALLGNCRFALLGEASHQPHTRSRTSRANPAMGGGRSAGDVSFCGVTPARGNQIRNSVQTKQRVMASLGIT
jgi:hypothetical protein